MRLFKIYNNEIPIPFQYALIKGNNYDKLHIHEETELLFFTKDGWSVSYENKLLTGNRNDFVIINSNIPHYINGCDYVYIKIKPDFFPDINLSANLFEVYIPENNFIINLFTDIQKEFSEKKEGFNLKINSVIYSLLSFLLKEYKINKLTRSDITSRENKAVRIRETLDYIGLNYNKHLTTSQLAKICNLNEIYFCTLFKNLTGISPLSYINKFRCEKAISLMENTDLNMSEISVQTGFNDSNYFSRTFKKYMGISPVKYKQMHFM